MPTYEVEIPGRGTFVVESPSPLSDIQAYQAAISQQQEPVEEPQLVQTSAPAEAGFFPSVKRGFLQAQMLGGDILPAMAGRLFGADEFAERQLREAAETQQRIQREVPVGIESYKDIGSISDAWLYAKEAVGESLASIIPSLITGGIAGVLARPAMAAANTAAKEAAERTLMGAAMSMGPPTQAALQKAKNEAIQAGVQAAEKVALRYQAVGGFAGSAAMNVPEVYQNVLQETGKESIPAALIAGGFNAALDAILPISLLARARKAGISENELMAAWYKRGAVGLGKGFLVEGSTEAAQEASSIAAENFVAENSDVFNSKNLERVINAGIRGGIGGGVISGAADIALGKAPPPEISDRQRAEQLQRDILGDIQKARAEQTLEEQKAAEEARLEAERPPSVDQLIDEARQSDGYGRLEQIKQRLLTFKSTPEIKQSLDVIKELQNRMVVEDVQRRAPAEPTVMDDKMIRSLGFVPGGEKSVYAQLLGRSVADPEVLAFLSEYAETRAKPQTKQRIERFLAVNQARTVPLTAEEIAGTQPTGEIVIGGQREEKEPKAPAEPKGPTERQEAIEFGKAIGATGEDALRGRVNVKAQSAAKQGDLPGVVEALSESKSPIVREIAARSRELDTGIVIDESASEQYEGKSAVIQQLSIDGAKMHLDALSKVRELSAQVDALPDGAQLPDDVILARIPAVDNGQDVGSLTLDDISRSGNSMFDDLPSGSYPLKTKEDFVKLRDDLEGLTQRLGEEKLALTSTGSSKMVGVSGVYDAANDVIRVPTYAAKDERVLAHELVHAQALKAIANPTPAQKPAVERLQKLYQHVKNVLSAKEEVPYGISSVQEFVAEGLSNPRFQFQLKRIKYENQSAWSSFVESIAKLLGLKKDNAFTELLSIYSELAPPATPAKPGKPKGGIMGSALLRDVNQALGGLSPSLLSEFSFRVETKRRDKKGRAITQWRNPLTPKGPLFRSGGEGDYIEIARALEERGYLEPGSVERDPTDAGERAKDLIKSALSGDEVLTVDEQTEQGRLFAERRDREEQKRLDALRENGEYDSLDDDSALEAENERLAIIEEADLSASDVNSLEDDDIPFDFTLEDIQNEQEQVSGKAAEAASKEGVAAPETGEAAPGAVSEPPFTLAEAQKPKPVKLSKETEAKIDELGKILERIMSKMGMKNVALSIVQDLRANGEYANRLIKLALDAESPVRDLRHESLHAMKELGFFSDAQWAALEKQARDKWIDKYLKKRTATVDGQQMSRYDAYMKLYNNNEDRVIEEAIADAFGDFDITKPPPGLMQAILRRMRDMFRAIKEAMGMANIDNAEDIFRRVEKGELKERMPAVQRQAMASLREGAEQTSVGIMDGRIKVDLGKNVTVDKVGGYFDNLVKEQFGKPLDYNDKAAMDRAIKIATDEVALQMKERKSGLDWYEQDVKKAFKQTIEIIPELKPAQKRVLFSIVAGIMSPQTTARDNWFIAAKAFEHYIKTGDIPGINPDNGNLWMGGTQSANKKVQLDFLNAMVKAMGEKKAVKWLMEDHTVKEINQFRKQYGGIVSGIEGKLTDMRPGLYAFGPKIGPFVSNLNGIHDVTVDKWMTRSFNRYFGTMTGPDGKIIDAPTEPQRRAVKALVNEVAKNANIKPYQVQSVLWFFEQRLFTKLGAQSPSYGFSDGSKRFQDYARDRSGKESVQPAAGADGARLSLRDASWTPERIEFLIDDMGYLDGRSKGFAAFVNPRDFIRATTANTGDYLRIFEEAGPLRERDLRENMYPPRLYVNDDWKITGHEGRHRMAGLAAAGITRAPVLLIMPSGAKRSERQSKTLVGQKFEKGSGSSIETTDLTPISYKTKDLLNEKFGGESQVRFSLRDSLGLYSELETKIEQMGPKVAPAPQWKTMIAALPQKGVKPEEIEWSGVKDWLDLQTGRVNKDDLLNYLKQGGIRVEETVLGGPKDYESMSDSALRKEYKDFRGYEAEDTYGDPMTREEIIDELSNAPNASGTKYADYTLPGGENYREVLLTLPNKKADRLRELDLRYNRGEKLTLEERQERHELLRDDTAKGAYQSSHWDQANIIAHIRLNDRTDADGNKVLFVEEIQSDWGQEGKKKGFKRGERMEEGQLIYDPKERERVPVAPFVTKTEGWLNLALKRIMVLAAEGGYDKVAFVNGDQSAERYNLSNRIDRIDHNKNGDGTYNLSAVKDGKEVFSKEEMSESELEDTVGKEIAKKIVAGEGKPIAELETVDRWEPEYRPELGGKGFDFEATQVRSLTGLDLKVGGEGMKTFYDTIVPTAVKKLLPKVGGGKIEAVGIQVPPTSAMYPERTTLRETSDQPGFDVTPDMKRKVETTGLPRFSLREEPLPKMNLRDQTDPAIRARVAQTITSREEKTFVQRILEAISPKSFSTFRQNALNRYNYLSVLGKKKVAMMGGADLLADADAEAAALLSDLAAGVTASALGVNDRKGGAPVYKHYFVVEANGQTLSQKYTSRSAAEAAAAKVNGVAKERGYTTVDNFKDTIKGPAAIFAPLAKYNDPYAYELFSFYSGVKRGNRFMYKIDPKTGKPVEKLFEPTDVQEAAKLEIQYPEFKDIHKEWIAYNDKLVDFMRDTGIIRAQNAAEFKAHGDYFPFYRQIDGDPDAVGPKIFQSIAAVKPPKKLKGSEAPLGDFLENIVRNTQSAVQAGMKNVAARRAAELGMDVGVVDEIGPGITPDPVTSFYVLENGLKKHYETSDLLFINAVKSLNMPDLPFIGMFAGPANLLRTLVTKDPGFILANLMRDSMSAWVTSGVKMTPIADTVANFGRALAKKSGDYEALLNAGVIGGYEFAQNVETSGREFGGELRRRAGTPTVREQITKPITSLWGALEQASTASDAATRMEVYKKTLAETGNEAEALFRALEVMNFNRKGSSAVVRLLTAGVPFLNARMQGLDILYRAAIAPSLDKSASDRAKQIQKTFFVRGSMIMAMSAMYWLMTHDDEDYKKQEQETKDNYWLLPSLGVKIPIPFEVGVLFKVIPERIMAYTMGTDTAKDFKDSMARQITNTLAFNPIPQTFIPIFEIYTNFSFFTRRPIIPQGLENVAPEYQVGPGTSKLAEGIGKTIGMSPMLIDQLIGGYTGTMGMYAVDLMDSIYNTMADSPKPSKRFEQMPVIRRFAVDPEARGAVTAYYDLRNAVDEAVRTTNLLERTMDYKNYGEFMKDNMKLLAAKDYVNDMDKTLKELREMKTQIRISTLSADQKRDNITSINRMENALVRNIQELKKMYQSGS